MKKNQQKIKPDQAEQSVTTPAAENGNTNEAAPQTPTKDEINGEKDAKKVSTENLAEQLRQAQDAAKQQDDKLLRVKAEMENIRRRASIDVQNAHKYGLSNFIPQLLPVIDSLENSLANSTEQGPLREGLELTLRLFCELMSKNAVLPIDPQNQPFNPNYHEAMSIQESAEVDADTVIAVMQKGYTLNERVIRPALVMVSKRPADLPESTKIDEKA